MIPILRDRTRRNPLIVAVASILTGSMLLAISTWMDGASGSGVSSASNSAFRKMALDLANKLDLLQGIERASYDWRAWLAAKFSPPAAPELGFVYINDRTIQDIGRGETLRGLPFGLLWPRYVYARVLRELNAQGAKAVGFDVFFKDIRHDHSELAVGGTNLVDSDVFFGEQIAQATNTTVILASLSNSLPAIIFRQGPVRLGDAFSLRDLDGMARRIRVFQDYVIPSKQLEVFAVNNDLRIVRFTPEVVLEDLETLSTTTNHPSAEGLIEVTSAKGVQRLIRPVERERVWHLGIVLASKVLGLDLSKATVEANRVILPGTNGTQRIIPIDHNGRMFVDWTVRVRNQQLLEEPFERVLESDVIRQEGITSEIRTNWAGKYVVVGSVATGNNMADVGPTPLGKEDFLVGTYINVANSIIQGRFVHRWGPVSELFLVLLLGTIATVVNLRLTPERATLAAIGTGILYLALVCVAFIQARLWLPVAHPVGGGLFLTHASLLTYRALFEQRERQRVKAVFSRLVSPNVVQELLKLERFSLGGARRQITVFFADVRGFTEMTDRRQAAAEEYVRAHGLVGEEAEAYYEHEAHEVLDTVNRYLAAIAEVIKQRTGTLDKYIGDCVMAFWGAPTPNPRHAVDAVLASIDAQRAIHQLNLDREVENQKRTEENRVRAEQGLPPLPPIEQLSLGTGVNTGTMMVGLMGSEAHTFNYTVFGREVNLASRLEGVSGRARIIIGEATYRELLQHAPELAALCVMRESVQVKGFRGAVSIYEVMWRLEAGEKTVDVKLPGGKKETPAK